MTDANKSISLSELFGSIVQSLQNDKNYLNHLDSSGGNANHGDNILHNFQVIKDTIDQYPEQAPSSQLMQAANQLRGGGSGATAALYAEGLKQAAKALQGKKDGLSLNEVVPFLQGLAGGVQSQTDARPGQGTLLDSLVPGVESYVQARNSGQSNAQAIMHAMSSALHGSRQVQNQPNGYSKAPHDGQNWVDPGANSATSILEGMFNKISSL